METELAEDVTANLGGRGLIRETLGSCPRDDDEKVEDATEHGYTEDNGCYGEIDLPKITGERGTEKQQSSLQHHRQRFHHMVKVPRNDAVQFSLPVVAAFDGRVSQVSRLIAVQPLFAEHCKESRKQ